MANNLTADHERAFAEIYALSGAEVDIDGRTVEALLPRASEREQAYDDDGVMHATLSRSITVRAADLPDITSTSVATVEGQRYRIHDTSAEGSIATNLELEAP